MKNTSLYGTAGIAVAICLSALIPLAVPAETRTGSARKAIKEFELEVVKIKKQPEQQLVQIGDPAQFMVQVARNESQFRYQWMFNCDALEGKTNSTLIIPNVQVTNVGFYTCFVHKETASTATTPAPLMAYSIVGEVIRIWHTPPPGGGGSDPLGCPRPYRGYVNFSKSVSPFGWLPKPGVTLGSATHVQLNTTDVKAWSGTIRHCSNSGKVTFSLVQNRPYRFAVFFPNSSFTSVPCGPQALDLVGFQP